VLLHYSRGTPHSKKAAVRRPGWEQGTISLPWREAKTRMEETKRAYGESKKPCVILFPSSANAINT
jgi:hypothetical protein